MSEGLIDTIVDNTTAAAMRPYYGLSSATCLSIDGVKGLRGVCDKLL